MHKKFIVIGNVFDSYFAIDLAAHLGQGKDIGDLVSLKVFSNTEFCPRYTLESKSGFERRTGKMLEGSSVILVSVHNDWVSRNELAMRNMILARSAHENGAARVVLVEPDLFYSAQDRGARLELGHMKHSRTGADLYKFNGQPFTAKLYGQLLKSSGVDGILTVHNHSISCQYEYERIFGREHFYNLNPDRLYHRYLCNSGIIDPYNTILVAPDDGGMNFVRITAETEEPFLPYLMFHKTRYDENHVTLEASDDSQIDLSQIGGKDLVIMDDMVRTGSTIAACTEILQRHSPGRIIVLVTHFQSSDEIKRILGNADIDDIVTTNTLPTILNRDHQGRLRRKMAVLKINKWIAFHLNRYLDLGIDIKGSLYEEDISGKNPRAHHANLSESPVFH